MLLSEDDKSRRDWSTVNKVQDNEFDKIRLTNLEIFTANRNPLLDENVAMEKIVDNELNKSTILRFFQPLLKFFQIFLWKH